MPVDEVSPRLNNIVPEGEDIQELGSGYVAAEGPVWWHESGQLLFSDHRQSCRYRWDPGHGVELIDDATNGGNGMTRDREGRLVVGPGSGHSLSRRGRGEASPVAVCN